MNEIRKDPVTGDLVIMSTGRGKRPTDFAKQKTFSTPENCFFCPGNEHLTPPTIYETGNPWKTRVFENKFPFLKEEWVKAYGRHEVIVATPDHNKTMGLMSVSETADLLRTYAQRYKALAKYKYVLVFQNYGSDAGASLSHLHSQLVAFDFVPIGALRELSGRCKICEVVKKEARGPRKIMESRKFLVLAPWASKHHYESWIVSRKHLGSFLDLDLDDLAHVMKDLFEEYERLLGDFSYNFILHQGKGKKFHFHLEVKPKLSTIAGLELGAGIYANSVLPETVASELSASLNKKKGIS